MIGRVGTIFGEHGVNIASAAVGAEIGRSGRAGSDHRRAGTRRAPDEILELDGFHTGRAVDL